MAQLLQFLLFVIELLLAHDQPVLLNLELFFQLLQLPRKGLFGILQTVHLLVTSGEPPLLNL